MPRRDHRKLKTQKLSSEGTQSTDLNTLKSVNVSMLDAVSDTIPDIVDSIMAKIDESKDTSSMSNGSDGFSQRKMEKEMASIKNDVESIKFDVVEILRQLPPRERRKPDTLGDVLNNIFSGKMDVADEDITFGNTPYTRKSGISTSYRTEPNTTWNTTISKIEEASDSNSTDISDSDSDLN